MDKKLEQRLKDRIKPIVERLLREDNERLDLNELKVISQYVNGLGAVPYLKYSTNNKTVIGIANEISGLRIKLMDYVEENSDYKFIGKSPNGWKLVKK